MPQSAKVTSIEALDNFKASLIVYLEKSAGLLDEIGEDVVRTRVWLQTDRQMHWRNQVRQRSRELAAAEQELLTARLSGMPEAVKARRMTVDKAKLALQQAVDGLNRVKRWIRQYETQVESHAKVVNQLRHARTYDRIKAVGFLERAAATLADYAGLSPPVPANTGAPAPADGAPAEPPAVAQPPSLDPKRPPPDRPESHADFRERAGPDGRAPTPQCAVSTRSQKEAPGPRRPIDGGTA